MRDALGPETAGRGMSVPPPVLAVDDPRQPLIRRAVFGAVQAAAIFFVFTVTKEVKRVYNPRTMAQRPVRQSYRHDVLRAP
jgi:hypothetical protein